MSDYPQTGGTYRIENDKFVLVDEPQPSVEPVPVDPVMVDETEEAKKK